MTATMLDAAGAGPMTGSHAESLLPVINGDEKMVREVAHSMIRMRPGLPTWVAVTDGQWRLTYELDTGECVEFFDLAHDPEENVNLVNDSSCEGILRRLKEMSRQEIASAGRTPVPDTAT